MTIKLQTIDQVKVVDKPWGYEKWIQPGSPAYPFVLKELCLLAGQRTSLQVHKVKSESIIALRGRGNLLTVDVDFDCDRYLQNLYTEQELNAIMDQLYPVDVVPGTVIHIPPGTIHRMVSIEDLFYMEASTTELDDVIRLQDDKNRTHGRIDNEHR